jgi:DNA-binding response OmpR family regulator
MLRIIRDPPLSVFIQDLPRRHRPVTPDVDTPQWMKTAAAARQVGRVLVVEDERDVAELIRYNLTREGYEVVVAATGADGLKQARELRPDLVLLDIMVPQLNGWEVCRRLKQDTETRHIPIIMVTGRVEEGDKVLGFEMGADDYVTKPFSPRELLARVRAVARRGRPGDPDKKIQLRVGELEIDRYRFQIRMKGRPVEVTPKEFELLAILAAAPKTRPGARGAPRRRVGA